MIQEKVISQMTVASSQHFVNVVDDELIEKFTHDFEKHLLEAKAEKTDLQSFFTVFHVDEYRDRDYSMELWVQVKSIKNDTENIHYKCVPKSEVVYIVVSENYENLKFAYDSLFKYVIERGYTVSGYPRETYIFEDIVPPGYFTEIQLPFIRNI